MNPVMYVLLALICASLGFVLATLVHWLRTLDRDVSPMEKGVADHPQEHEKRIEVLRIWRMPDDDQLVIELEGQRVDPDHQPTNIQKALINRILAGLTGGKEYPQTAIDPVPPLNQNLAYRSSNQNLPGRADADNGNSTGLRPGDDPSDWLDLEAVKPSLNPFKNLVRAARGETLKRLSAPPKSIAAQIDEILQAKLAAAGVMDLGVRLMETPLRGMVIQIGDEEYEAVEFVPDSVLRGMIQESVTQWETRAQRKKS